ARLGATSHVDERGAAFFALGLAKATGVPAVLACTSGTAAANYAPAVIEAYESRVPMIVLTADRPPELRDVGAGQTIDQLKLYGDAVKWFFEVGTETATPESLRWIRTLACRAYATALHGPPGPVHLNFPLREPLVLEDRALPHPHPRRGGGRAVGAVGAAGARAARRRPTPVRPHRDRGRRGARPECGPRAGRLRGPGQDPPARRPALRLASRARRRRPLRP